MPTPIVDLKGLSSPSYFSEDSGFPSQTQVRSCRSEILPEQYGTNSTKPFDSSPFQKISPLEAEKVKSPEHGPFADPSRANGRFPQYENSLFSSSLPELFSRKLKLSGRGTHVDQSMAPLHYDEGEPLTSLEEIEAQTIGNLLPNDDDLLSGVTEGFDFVMQQQPNGDDLEELDVFSNMGGMDLEDCDSSSITQKNINLGVINGSAAHPSWTRTLFVRNINSNIDDSELRILFEQYGEVHNLYTACKQRGFVMVSYYDIRAARKAMESLQNRSMRGRRLDIHYSIPKDNPSEKDTNQGMLLVSNLDTSVSNDDIHSIFSSCGDIKEIQNVTQRSHQWLIEYFDIRAEEAALRALNGSNIAGKQIKLERFPSGRMNEYLQLSNELEQGKCDPFIQQHSPSNHPLGFSGRIPLVVENGAALGMKSSVRVPFLGSPVRHGISSSFVPDGLPSLLRGVESGNPPGQLKFDIQESTHCHPHSLPEYQDGFMNGIHNSPNLMGGANFSQRLPETMDSRQLHRIGSNGHSLEQGVFGSAGSSPVTGGHHHLMWGNSSSSYRSQPPSAAGMMWQQNSPSSYFNGISRLHSLPSSMLNATLNNNLHHHHVGSAPAVNHPATIWDRQQQQQQAYGVVGSPEISSAFHPSGSFGNNMRMISKSSLPHSVDFNMFPPPPQVMGGLQSPHQRCMMFPGGTGRGGQVVVPSFDPPPNEQQQQQRVIRSSHRRNNEGGAAASSQSDKKQFELDIDRIIRGDDTRTTLMIKNIPNKYTSKMLLAAIDEYHRGTYDFIYLPIDFKNKCNVGYAFINMIDPTQIIPFYKAFNGKKWEKFNSEKVASLAYGRIQGKAALIAHFQNSSLMNEDKRCRPILFNTDGPNAGDQVPFPMGVNIRSRPGKTRGSSISPFEEMATAGGGGGGDSSSSNRDASISPTRDLE